jgi:hypothetical protein
MDPYFDDITIDIEIIRLDVNIDDAEISLQSFNVAHTVGDHN